MATEKAVRKSGKSTKKSTVANLRPLSADDPRRGRGPAVGAPNAGRPPSEIRALLRTAFYDRIPMLQRIADDEELSPSDRMKAADMLAKYGLGSTVTATDTEGKEPRHAVVILPAIQAAE